MHRDWAHFLVISAPGLGPGIMKMPTDPLIAASPVQACRRRLQGVDLSMVLLLFLTEGVLQRPFVQKEVHRPATFAHKRHSLTPLAHMCTGNGLAPGHIFAGNGLTSPTSPQSYTLRSHARESHHGCGPLRSRVLSRRASRSCLCTRRTSGSVGPVRPASMHRTRCCNRGHVLRTLSIHLCHTTYTTLFAQSPAASAQRSLAHQRAFLPLSKVASATLASASASSVPKPMRTSAMVARGISSARLHGCTADHDTIQDDGTAVARRTTHVSCITHRRRRLFE